MKKECIVCGGEEFFSSTLYARTKQDWAYAPNMYRFEKVFIEHRDEENYPASRNYSEALLWMRSYYVVSRMNTPSITCVFFKTLTKQADKVKVNKTEKLPKPIAVYPSVLLQN